VKPLLFHTPPIDSCHEEIYVNTVSALFPTPWRFGCPTCVGLLSALC
jgi:hypothetical protein